MRSKIAFALFLLAAAMSISGIAHSIVILPPVVYFASVSIAGFLANALISLAALAAIAGAANWKVLGKPLPQAVSAAFGFISTALVGLFAMLACAVLFNPVGLLQILSCALAVFIVCMCLFSLRDYRLLRACATESLFPAIKKIAVFSIVFAALFVPSAFFAIEFRQVNPVQAGVQGPQGQTAAQGQFNTAVGSSQSLQQQDSGAQSPLAPSQEQKQSAAASATNAGASVPTAAPASGAPSGASMAQGNNENSQQPQLLEFYFLPSSPEDCIVSIGSSQQPYKPSEGCFSLPDALSQQQFCPIQVAVPAYCTSGLAINSSGSCSQQFELSCENSSLHLAQNQ